MATGQKIDDHGSWIGKGANGTVFPQGVKLKNESSAEGAGEVMKYEDTSEAIKSTQNTAKAKVKARPMKDGNRN